VTESTNPPGPAAPGPSFSPVSETLAALKRLPDLRAALEALILFLLVLLAGAWAVSDGVITLDPMPRGQMATIWLSAFVMPVLLEELVFRGWLPRGAPRTAILSFLAFVLWHPLQVWLNLPFARPEFTRPGFLMVVACLGFACTLTRIRSGSLWPGVVIHWGVVVAWLALFGGQNAAVGALQSP
jgi:predicted Abi (CAAX) family protease